MPTNTESVNRLTKFDTEVDAVIDRLLRGKAVTEATVNDANFLHDDNLTTSERNAARLLSVLVLGSSKKVKMAAARTYGMMGDMNVQLQVNHGPRNSFRDCTRCSNTYLDDGDCPACIVERHQDRLHANRVARDDDWGPIIDDGPQNVDEDWVVPRSEWTYRMTVSDAIL